MRPDYALDANLVLLLVVGNAGKEEIGKHKKLDAYDADDHDLLLAVLSGAREIIVPPNVLTETSNLLGHGSDTRHVRLAAELATVIGGLDERFVSSEFAVRRAEYARLGLTDAVLLHLASIGATLLTADWPLCVAALSAGYQAIHFSQVRELDSDRI